MRGKIALSVALALMIALPAHASTLPFLDIPFYSQNFDGLTNGPINGQDGWTSSSSEVVQSAVALSGKALEVGGGTGAIRSSVSTPLTFSTTHAFQAVEFDILLEQTITDHVGTPNVDIQQTLQFRGPKANQQFFLVYKGVTDGAGNVFTNRFEFRSGTTVSSPNTVLKNQWYHIVMDANFVDRTLNGLITDTSGVFYDAPVQTNFFNDGNINFVGLFADTTPLVKFYIDNFVVLVPEPAAMALPLLGALALRRRRGRA